MEWSVSAWRQPTPSRLEADIGGHLLYIESEDGVPLTPHPEALIGLCLLPAQLAGASLQTEVSVSPNWAENAEKISAMAAGWWPARSQPLQQVPRQSRSLPAAGTGRAQCFTAGLDSIFAFIDEKPAATHFFYVQDFEAPEAPAFKHLERAQAVRAAAAENGVKAVILRSNARQHPLLGRSSWIQIHGGMLINIAMTASAEFGSLTVPSSFPVGHEQAWGSHPTMDPLWSLPGVFTARHASHSLGRFAKLQQVVERPSLLKYLRVCARARKPGQSNCGQCRKCLRVMLNLSCLGATAAATNFDWSVPLVKRLDQLKRVPDWDVVYWQASANNLEQRGHRDLAQACQRVIRRSRFKNWLAKPDRWLRSWRAR